MASSLARLVFPLPGSPVMTTKRPGSQRWPCPSTRSWSRTPPRRASHALPARTPRFSLPVPSLDLGGDERREILQTDVAAVRERDVGLSHRRISANAPPCEGASSRPARFRSNEMDQEPTAAASADHPGAYNFRPRNEADSQNAPAIGDPPVIHGQQDSSW